jgi:hypothetical protein
MIILELGMRDIRIHSPVCQKHFRCSMMWQPIFMVSSRPDAFRQHGVREMSEILGRRNANHGTFNSHSRGSTEFGTEPDRWNRENSKQLSQKTNGANSFVAARLPTTVGYLTQRNRRFRPRCRFGRLSHQTYEFLTRSARLKKRMAVWDNAPTTRRRKSKIGGLFGLTYNIRE